MSTLEYREKENDTPSVSASPFPGHDHDFVHGTTTTTTSGSQALRRTLRGKEVQLFAIGGAIGTCTIIHPDHSPHSTVDDG